MKQLVVGVSLGALLGVGGVYGCQALEPECGGLCGEGTSCEQGVCVVDADRTVNEASGPLGGSVLLSEVRKLNEQLQACVRDASEHVDELGSGMVDYSFAIAGSGKVTSVDVSTPEHLKAAGLEACVRKVVYAHQFPRFDGPEMTISAKFSLVN